MTEEVQEHSTRSPSGAHGWRRCPGKINAERGRPDRVGREAAEGTLFHDYAERCVLTGVDPQFFLPGSETVIVSGHAVCFNEEMVENMLAGLQFIYSLLTEDAILMVEQRVRIEPWTLEPGGFGTSDICIIFPKRRKIIVFDWKYGKVAVSPINNDQEIIYGLGCWESFAGEIFNWDPTDIVVELVIWQPRVPGGGGSWETTMEWLLAEGNQIRIDAAATYDPDAPRIAGAKQCHYCKVQAECPERAAYNLALFGARFDDIDEAIEWETELELADPGEWTAEHRSYVWLHRKSFTRWLDTLKEAIMLDAQAGKETPLIKVVPGNAGKRTVKADFQEDYKNYLVTVLGEEVALKPQECITPAVAEKKLGKKRFKEDLGLYITQADPKPMLVPVTDTRQALPSKMIQFDDILEEEDDDAED